MSLEALESRALLAVTLPPSISSDTVEIDDNLVVANGSWSVTATGGTASDGHVQIFGNSRGRIDGTPGDLNEDLTLSADTFITVTGAIGATNRIDDLTLTSATAQPVNLQQAVYITGTLRVTNAASFTIGSTVDVDGNLVIDAATSVMFSGNVNVDGDLTITNATSVTFAGTLRVGGQLTISNVSGSTRFAGDVSVGAAAITSATLVQVQANFASTGAAGDGDVTFTTDQISLAAGTIESSAGSGGPSSTLTVKPRTTSRDLTIGSPPGIPSGVNITDADLFAIQPGWKRVVFGDEAAGTGAVRIGSIGSQYGGFSQVLNTTTIVGGTVQVVQPVDVTDLADYLELIALGTGTPGSGSVTINAAINQTADERNNWVRIASAGAITLNAPIWSDQTISLTTTAGGTIAQGTSAAAITTVALAVDADGSVTLADSGNAVSTLAMRTTNDSIVFREDSGYSIMQITRADSARDVQQSTTVTGIDAGSGTVRLVTISGQTPSTVGQGRAILARGLGLEGTNTDWSLSLPTNDVATLAGDTGSIDFRDADDLTIDTVAAVSPRSGLSGITVARTLSATAGTTLTITAAGDIISASSSGTAITLSAPSGISTAGAIETSGADAIFNNATTLTGDVVVDLENGSARGGITFASTVQGTTSGPPLLTIGGNLDARGSIGSTTALESLSVSGDSTFTGGITLRTIGNQTYSGAATSTGTITVQAGSSSTVGFLGNTSLGGLVTATADTASYSVVLTGASVSVTAPMTFANTGTVTLGNEATDSLLFAGGLTSTAPSTTNLAGTISTTDANPSTPDANASFGRQPGGSVVLTSNTTISTGTADATFGGTVDSAAGGPFALTVNAAGTTTFAAAVGGTRALTSLTTNAGGTTRINGGSITTSGAAGQVYGDAVQIGGSDATLTAGTGPVSFNGTVDSTTSGGFGLTVTASGLTSFTGAVGTTALKFLATNGGGTTRITGGAITTSGTAGQVYGDAVEIGVLDATLTAGTGPVSFNGTVDSATGSTSSLTVNATGTTTFAAAVGSTSALESLTTNAGGSTAINGGSIRTSGLAGQVFNDAVTLGANTTLDADAGAITFGTILNGALNAAYTLAVNTTGTTTFGDAVGGTSRLVSLTTNAGGFTAINGGSIRTSGAEGQVFNDAVTLGNNTTLDAIAGAITFASTVDSNVVAARSLTVDTQGEVWFADTVGGTRPLASLETNASGTTRITSDSITTTGAQTYNDPVTFAQPLAPTSISILVDSDRELTGSTISLLQGLDAAGKSLFLRGDAVFGDQPGSPLVDNDSDRVDPIISLNGLVVTGTSLINSNIIASNVTMPSNPVTFQSDVTLGSDVTIVGSSLAFRSTISGPGRTLRASAVNFGGSSSIVFDGDVGTAQTPLGPITILDPQGAVTINAAMYSTGPVVIGAYRIDGNADNAIRVVGGRISLSASTGIGGIRPIAVQADSVTASTDTGNIRLRGIGNGDLTVGAPGLFAPNGTIDVTALGQIRVPGGNTIVAANGVTSNRPIRWGLLGTADSGPGSLRSVIAIANATRTAGVIEFATGQSTFVLQSPLPQITIPLTIDGGTGSSSVVIDGNSGVSSGLVFTAQAAGSVLSNVLLRNFTGFGVQLVGAGNMVVDNIIVRSLNTSRSMGLYATGSLAGTLITGSVFSGGLRGALLDNARNLTFGLIGRGNTLANNVAARNNPQFAGTGIRAQGNCSGTIVTGNTFASNNYGFAFVNAQNLSLRQNTFDRNTVGIFIQGICTGSTQSGNVFGSGRNRNGVNVYRARPAQGT